MKMGRYGQNRHMKCFSFVMMHITHMKMRVLHQLGRLGSMIMITCFSIWIMTLLEISFFIHSLMREIRNTILWDSLNQQMIIPIL